MAKRFTDEELKKMRLKGVKAPFPLPVKKEEFSKDPSVRALQDIGKSLSEQIKSQGDTETALRKEMQAILGAVMATIAKAENKEVEVKLDEKRPKKWKHTVKRDLNNLIVEITSEAL